MDRSDYEQDGVCYWCGICERDCECVFCDYCLCPEPGDPCRNCEALQQDDDICDFKDMYCPGGKS